METIELQNYEILSYHSSMYHIIIELIFVSLSKLHTEIMGGYENVIG